MRARWLAQFTNTHSRPLNAGLLAGLLVWSVVVLVADLVTPPLAGALAGFYLGGLWYILSFGYASHRLGIARGAMTRALATYPILYVPALGVAVLGPTSALFLTACTAGICGGSGLLYILRKRRLSALGGAQAVMLGAAVLAIALITTRNVAFASVVAACVWTSLASLGAFIEPRNRSRSGESSA
jgi:hypothetical protein